MSRYEVIMSVVVEAEDSEEAYLKAVNLEHISGMALVEEDGIRILPDSIFDGTYEEE